MTAERCVHDGTPMVEGQPTGGLAGARWPVLTPRPICPACGDYWIKSSELDRLDAIDANAGYVVGVVGIFDGGRLRRQR